MSAILPVNYTKRSHIMTAVRKETTKNEAEVKAATKKSIEDCKQGILDEAEKLASGDQHSIQQLLAYQRQLNKFSKKK